MAMQAGLKNVFDGITLFSGVKLADAVTNLTEDLKKFNVPTFDHSWRR